MATAETEKVIPMNRAGRRRAARTKPVPTDKPKTLKLDAETQEDFDAEGAPLVEKQKRLESLRAELQRGEAEFNDHVSAIRGLLRRFARRNGLDASKLSWGWDTESQHIIIVPLD